MAQSPNLQYAEQLAKSQNPFVAQLRQEVLGKALTEVGDARAKRNEQQFQQGQTGYTADLQDYGNATDAARRAQAAERTGAQERNFSRETKNTDMTFTAGQNDLNRRNQYAIALLGENRQDARSSGKLTGRNPYWDSVAGMKLQKENEDKRKANSELDEELAEFTALNEKVPTGWKGLIPGAGLTSEQRARMDHLSGKLTIGALGGKLGGNVSDADVKLISGSHANAKSPEAANISTSNLMRNVVRRDNERLLAWEAAQDSNIGKREFGRKWQRYVDKNPIAARNKDGSVGLRQYVPFDVFLQAENGTLPEVK
jgi:hypothetical protein